MKNAILTLLISALLAPAFAGANSEDPTKGQDPYRYLSQADYDIYLRTFNKCHTGTLGAAFKTTIDPRIMKSAATNLVGIVTLSLQASRERMQAHGLSPELYKQTHSDGFWIAFRDCYAGSSEARVILIKNIIDMGHLTSELVGTVGTVAVAAELLAFKVHMMALHPVVSRLVMTAGLSITLDGRYKAIKHEFFAKASPEEAELIRTIERDMFQDVNETIAQIVQLSTLRMANLDRQLANPKLSKSERSDLMSQKEKLKSQTDALRLNPKN